MNVLFISGFNLMSHRFFSPQLASPDAVFVEASDVVGSRHTWDQRLHEDETPWTIVGHSAGAVLALDLAAKHPNVKQVVTLSLSVKSLPMLGRLVVWSQSLFDRALEAGEYPPSTLEPEVLATLYTGTRIPARTVLIVNQMRGGVLNMLTAWNGTYRNILGEMDLPGALDTHHLLLQNGCESVVIQGAGHLAAAESPAELAKILLPRTR